MSDHESRHWKPETGSYEGLKEIVRERRMVYKYASDPVPEADIERILDAARWAPSGHNSQPWEFVVVRDDERLELLADVLKSQRNWMTDIDERFPAHGRVYLDQVPVAIVVLGDVRSKSYFPNVDNFGAGEREITDAIYHESIGCCMQTIHLAAKSLGYGTVHLTVRHHSQDQLRELLDVPEQLMIHDIVPLGVPADENAGQNVDRQPLEQKLHYETFDDSQFRTNEEFIEDLEDQGKRVRLMHGDSS
ncbi:hypothetical protein GS429_00225 [Natronorubrum sp. JWXQ-INN-674]|uniref:Nitroreductase domain-containing protein n=1 Tax=Natronorubrum halalkaliphilum TaxID=2691917 RepID=A0A6B0VG92_9EURY|nr:nitroreductase family protein [Natronorubrum halalkaliphilum]MXV60518.1 hypothetical protein [Natronorubrum halalkaliphilum]